jgi:hypothetical protein
MTHTPTAAPLRRREEHEAGPSAAFYGTFADLVAGQPATFSGTILPTQQIGLGSAIVLVSEENAVEWRVMVILAHAGEISRIALQD